MSAQSGTPMYTNDPQVNIFAFLCTILFLNADHINVRALTLRQHD